MTRLAILELAQKRNPVENLDPDYQEPGSGDDRAAAARDRRDLALDPPLIGKGGGLFAHTPGPPCDPDAALRHRGRAPPRLGRQVAHRRQRIATLSAHRSREASASRRSAASQSSGVSIVIDSSGATTSGWQWSP